MEPIATLARPHANVQLLRLFFKLGAKSERCCRTSSRGPISLITEEGERSDASWKANWENSRRVTWSRTTSTDLVQWSCQRNWSALDFNLQFKLNTHTHTRLSGWRPSSSSEPPQQNEPQLTNTMRLCVDLSNDFLMWRYNRPAAARQTSGGPADQQQQKMEGSPWGGGGGESVSSGEHSGL